MKMFMTAALAILLACPAVAQQCIPQEKAVRALTVNYLEEVIDEHVKEGVTYQVWVNQDTNAWSFTGSMNGTTCMLAHGKDYEGKTVADFLGEVLGEAL